MGAMRWVAWGGLLAAAAVAVALLGDGGEPGVVAPSVELADVEAAEEREAAPVVVVASDDEPRALARDVFGVASFARFSGRVVAADEGGAPLAGATVWHVPDETTLAAMDFDVSLLSSLDGGVESILPRDRMTSTVTDAEGAFAFEVPSLPLAGGRRWPDVPMLVVEHPEMATRPFRCAGFLGGHGAVFDAGTLALQSGATVTARVLSGVDGLPVADAVMSVWSATWSETWGQAVDISRWGWLDYRRDFLRFTEGRPDAEGRIELRGIGSGVLTVRIDHPTLAPFTPRPRVVDRSSTWDLGDVELGVGGLVEAVVVDADSGALVTGAAITVVELVMTVGPDGRDMRAVRRATTDARGFVRIEGLEPRIYAAVLRAPGYREAFVPAVVPDEGEVAVWEMDAARMMPVVLSTTTTDLDDMTLEAWGVSDEEGAVPQRLDIRRLPGADGIWDPFALITLSGSFDRVVLRTTRPGYVPTVSGVRANSEYVSSGAAVRLYVSGVVVDDVTGEPVAGAVVRAAPRGRSVTPKPWDVVHAATTDEAGRFEMVAPTTSWAHVQAQRGDGVVSPVVTIRAQAGDVASSAVVRIGAGAEIRGRFVDPLNRPIEEAEVLLDGPDTRRTRTGRDGVFRFGGLRDGLYELSGEPNALVELSLQPRARRDVVLMADLPSRLRGHVKRGRSAEPYASVFVRKRREHVVVEATSDVNGFFEVELPSPGSYEIFARAPSGHTTTPKRVTTTAGQVEDIDLTFGALATVGSVRGDPRGLVAVVVLDDAGLGWGVPVAPDGTFELRDIPPVPVRYVLTSGDADLESVEHDLPVAQLTPFTVAEPPRSAQVVVTFGPSWGSGRLGVTLTGERERYERRDVAAERDGVRRSYVFDGLDGGRYVVEARGRRSVSQEVRVDPGTVAFVAFD